jgi:hypothetical protein
MKKTFGGYSSELAQITSHVHNLFLIKVIDSAVHINFLEYYYLSIII